MQASATEFLLLSSGPGTVDRATASTSSSGSGIIVQAQVQTQVIPAVI